MTDSQTTNTLHAGPFDGISIVIPAFNESARIGATISTIEDYAGSHFRDWEIVVVDDGSKDDTEGAALRAIRDASKLVIVKNPGNRGKGYSTRNGCGKARFPYVLMSDADLSTPIEEIEKLAPFASPETVVIASRGMKESDLLVRQPWYRERMGRVFNRIVQILLLPGIHDSQCGFKLFGKEIVERVMPLLETDGFAFDVEVLARAKRMGYAIREVPVRWRNDKGTKVSAISDSARMFKDILSVRAIVRRQPVVRRPV